MSAVPDVLHDLGEKISRVFQFLRGGLSEEDAILCLNVINQTASQAALVAHPLAQRLIASIFSIGARALSRSASSISISGAI